MSYRIFIPTAGTGSRLGKVTKYINKSLVSIANRPVISHQIEQFPEDCEFVIALGHKGNLVKDFLELTYPKKIFHFVEVDPFEGNGSGLGLSMLACEDFLQEPFVFLSCDTLVKESIQPPNHNWMGYSKVNDLMSYRTLDIDNERVKKIILTRSILLTPPIFLRVIKLVIHSRLKKNIKYLFIKIDSYVSNKLILNI